MKKSNKNLSKVTVVMLLITMIALIALAGTYAKYTTTASGTGTATVAKWDVSTLINGSKGVAEFDLYDTITHDIATGSLLEKRIAPGTSGSFFISLENNSEVGVNYEIKLTPISTTDIPAYLKFKVNGQAVDIATENTLATGRIEVGAADKTQTIIVDWEWPYETGTAVDGVVSGDAQDTEDGIAASTLKFKVSAIATQMTIQTQN